MQFQSLQTVDPEAEAQAHVVTEPYTTSTSKRPHEQFPILTLTAAMWMKLEPPTQRPIIRIHAELPLTKFEQRLLSRWHPWYKHNIIPNLI